MMRATTDPLDVRTDPRELGSDNTKRDASVSNSEKLTPRPKRALGGQRWTVEEDDFLLDLVKREQEWIVIAAELERSYSSVQNRFRFLKQSQEPAAPIVPLVRTRAWRPDSAPDLSCGALSVASRQVVGVLWEEIRHPHEPPEARDQVRTIIGATVREVMLCRLTSGSDWLRITVSQVNAGDHGVPREAFRNIIARLEACGFLERFVGYLGALKLDRHEARKGRLVWLRAAPRLIDLCESHGINGSNLTTHFPSLSG
jgi:hypothetical protein